MPTVLHGTGVPKLVINTTTVLLPHPKEFREYFVPEVLEKKLYGGSTSYYIKGWWYHADLDFSDSVSLAVLQSLDNLYDISVLNAQTITFYPRNSTKNYVVKLDPDSVLTLQQRPFNRGHKNFVLKLIGTTRLTSIDLTSTS